MVFSWDVMLIHALQLKFMTQLGNNIPLFYVDVWILIYASVGLVHLC